MAAAPPLGWSLTSIHPEVVLGVALLATLYAWAARRVPVRPVEAARFLGALAGLLVALVASMIRPLDQMRLTMSARVISRRASPAFWARVSMSTLCRHISSWMRSVSALSVKRRERKSLKPRSPACMPNRCSK